MHQTVLKADVRIKRKRCFKFRIESKMTLYTCCPVLVSHLSHLSCFVVNFLLHGLIGFSFRAAHSADTECVEYLPRLYQHKL